MTKNLVTLFFGLLFFSSIHLNAQCFPCNCECGWGAEFRVAYYQPESKRFREVYDNNLVDYQIELSKTICEDWNVWLDVDYTTKKGHSTYFRNPTRFYLVPIALGVSYNFDLCDCWDLYLGAGVNYSYLHIHDDSNYVKEHVKKWNWGGTFKVGVKKEFCGGFVVDLFVDYFLQDFHFSNNNYSSYSNSYSGYVERNNLNLSGIKVGGGIGYRF